MSARPFRVYGLTGGIASGKSTVARLFTEIAGIPVVDADQVSRGLSAEGGAAHSIILKRFGTTERARLREIVFADENARHDLEAILHPLIREESERQLRAAAEKSPAPIVLYEAALLVESGRYRDFDGLIVVEAAPEERIRRLRARDGQNEQMARQILAAQLPDKARSSVATHRILNIFGPPLSRGQHTLTD